ncbi:single-stranded DNA-binding protein [Pseudarthrobacter sp. NIBRBAC000502772]|uniref:single-stranded DNA-binding protein n=1 Tax=Pseudarthrobacter sp. NIBRBAC000502772 TaxID=2590775 RepID=UPI0011327572|nr:single-stranded DNA-binding protein [Pseudarthrobacter sp. NIBRBAC000502772]QDG65823.1 single-stranded DNA-binding protein [Pseudarthrobacter sp. NIBRBAC000502772]
MADIKFTGNVGKDAELRFLPSGRAVLNFSVADSKSKKLDSGEWETLAEQWLDCAIWGELAEFYAEKIRRGARVTVYGDFMSRKYEAKDGSKGTSLDVNVKGVEIYPPKNGGGSSQSGNRSNGGSVGSSAQEDPWATPGVSNAGGWGNSPATGEPPF